MPVCRHHPACYHRAFRHLVCRLQDDRRRGFDLARPPLLRLALHRLKDDHYQFVWTSHHILIDGRSRQILLEELFAIYDALATGTPPALSRDA